MEIDVKIGEESISIEVDNPFKLDIGVTESKITEFARLLGTDLSRLNVGNLIARMIKGVAGCEHGCPADAKTLVRQGFGRFNLSYIDGGILAASCPAFDAGPEAPHKSLVIKVFPDF
jgi:hypothetical protein